MSDNPSVITPSGGSSAPGAGTVTPSTISTSPTDTFVFPDNIDIQGQGNGGVTGAIVTYRGQGVGAQDFTVKNVSGSLYWRNESTNQFLMHLDSGAGALVMGAYGINLNNLQIVNVGYIVAGASGADAAAIIQANSTTQGFLPPRMTSAQKNAIATPPEGLMVYDTDLHAPCVYNGTGWKTVTIA